MRRRTQTQTKTPPREDWGWKGDWKMKLNNGEYSFWPTPGRANFDSILRHTHTWPGGNAPFGCLLLCQFFTLLHKYLLQLNFAGNRNAICTINSMQHLPATTWLCSWLLNSQFFPPLRTFFPFHFGHPTVGVVNLEFEKWSRAKIFVCL